MLIRIIIGTLVLLAVVLLLSLLFFRFTQTDRSKSAALAQKTSLYAKTEQRINDFYIDIDRNKLTPWSFFRTGKMPEVKYYDGKPINYKGEEGLEFEPTARLVFWGNFIEPFLEHGIIEILEQVKDEARESKLNPELCINEAVDLLDSVITKVYHRMAKIDQNLRGKGYPKNVKRKDVSQKIETMVDYLQQQQMAFTEIAKSQSHQVQKAKYLEHRKFVIIIILTVIGIIVTAIMGIPMWISHLAKTEQRSTESTNIFADVSKDGTILRSNEFPWEIKKTKDQDGNILYTLVGRRGDSTAISVVPDNPKYTVYQSYGGMVIKFTCAEEKISDFTIKVKY